MMPSLLQVFYGLFISQNGKNIVCEYYLSYK